MPHVTKNQESKDDLLTQFRIPSHPKLEQLKLHRNRVLSKLDFHRKVFESKQKNLKKYQMSMSMFGKESLDSTKALEIFDSDLKSEEETILPILDIKENDLISMGFGSREISLENLGD